jgi:hypothetical protein
MLITLARGASAVSTTRPSRTITTRSCPL